MQAVTTKVLQENSCGYLRLIIVHSREKLYRHHLVRMNLLYKIMLVLAIHMWVLILPYRGTLMHREEEIPKRLH